MKREKRLTKREKKASAPRPQGVAGGQAERGHDHHHHIHCTACGKHLDLEMFESTPPEAAWLRCDHGSEFASCVEHTEKTREMLAEHDRTGKPVAHVEAWH